MDPFTEKLLERTRARRENLQKKMAERPNAANRPMAKRPREPLADTNSVLSEPVIDKVPLPSSKPSPSKRLCSGENIHPPTGEENKEPEMNRPVVPMLADPPTDKKPPVGPSSRHSSLEKTATRPDVRSQPVQLKTEQPQPEKIAVTPSPNLSSKDEELVPASPALHRTKEDMVEDPAPSAAGMKSRLQRLAEQRQCWDGNAPSTDATPDCAPMSLLKRQAEDPPVAAPPTSSGNPVGRRGRLANLAATIGSWEDDLSHANIPKENPKEKPAATKFVVANTKPSAAESQSASSSKPTSRFNQQAACPPVKSSQVVPPSPKKPDRAAPQTVSSPQKSSNQTVAFTSSPLKSYNQGTTVPSSPKRAGPSSTASVPQSPLKSQVLSRGLNSTASPQKPELCAKPVIAGPSASQEKSTAGGPGVKSFLERFGERCQERNNQCSPAGGSTQAKTPTATQSMTPNTKLVQERLRAAQAANTTTADLTQRQKMERETELAKIRSRFQSGNNMWKNKDEATESKKINIKEHLDKTVQSEAASCEQQEEASAPPVEKTDTPTKCTPSGHMLAVSPPALTSSPRMVVPQPEEKPTDEPEPEEEVVTEKEMNVDQSINSAVINGLFDGVLGQDDDDYEDEDEEEDALNISSMSLLTPLASVVKSPERGLMTSTPASSFLIKSPDNVRSPSKYPRTDVTQISSSDRISDEDRRLPYSIDAYRSTRGKEMERPNVKQVIVRKEDVSQRAEEPRGSSLFSVKQKTKILTNEMNLQQTIIHQASQALNCCTDEEHGKGSQVEAEAERLLEVAMQRREALKAELDRLRGGVPVQKKTPAAAAPEPSTMSASKGSITLQGIRLPLKADFVCSIANKPESTKYSFFIMIRAGAENTVATPLASTHRGLSGDTLTFPTKFTLSDVSGDFAIDIEVYCLVQKPEVSGDKKKKASKSKAITPKRFLGITKSVQTPVLASPGGPNAVRSSHFALVGSHKLTLSSIGKNKFPLEKIIYEGSVTELLSDMFHIKVPFLCPLEGHVYLKMQCEVGSKVEERGFLTMFEDVSGFGAWHRRWCVLSGYCVSYWTYPDDEKRKAPIGRINLSNCTSKRVEPANREFCARPNTFELITVRPQREDDKETLVSQCKDTMCVTKNWLSADTKDERNLWMKKMNQILVDLRMWQPDGCYRPL